MQFFKLTAVAALLAGAALSASAMTSIDDESLAQVSGQDGVSIAANLNINIGSFTYTNVSGGASMSFNNIGITGLVAMTMDVVSNAQVNGEVGALIAKNDGTTLANATAAGAALKAAAGNATTAAGALVAGGMTAAQATAALGSLSDLQAAAGFLGTGDVIKIAFPNLGISAANAPSVTVGSVTLGGSSASFGSFAMNQINLQGTSVYIWAH